MMRLVDFILILPIVISVDSASEKLKCYQCETENNNDCTDKYLDLCPNDQAYDRCMTRISKTKTTGFLIRKTCALAPCTLRDQRQNEGLGLDDCDTSKEEYDCISCCKESGCNKSRAAIYRQGISLICIFAAVFTILRTITT